MRVERLEAAAAAVAGHVLTIAVNRPLRLLASLIDVGHVQDAAAQVQGRLDRVGDSSALPVADHKAVIAFCKANHIDLVVVGPEAPLVAGLVDDLEAAGLKAF